MNHDVSWKKVLILATGICIFSAVAILWLVISAVGPRMVPPKFSFTLVDNGENDYIDIKLISSGGYPVPLKGDVRIIIYPIYVYYPSTWEPINFTTYLRLYPTNSTRFYFNDDVVKKGTSYVTLIVKAPFCLYPPIFEKVICE